MPRRAGGFRARLAIKSPAGEGGTNAVGAAIALVLTAVAVLAAIGVGLLATPIGTPR